MRSLFEKNLLRAKQELTDLKTVHNRGLGTVEFFRYRVSFAVAANSWHSVTGTIAAGEPTNPLVIGLAKGAGDTADVVVRHSRTGTSTVYALIFARKATTATVDLISSSVLTGVTAS